MAGFTDKVQEVIRFIAQGFERPEGDGTEDVFGEMENADGDVIYPTDNGAALDPIYPSSTTAKRDNVLRVENHPSFRGGYEVVVSEPRSYDESVSIVKLLKDKKTIILNLHLLDREQSIRIVDFLCGATHALGGNQQKISDLVFIFTPNSVMLSAESQKKKFISDGVWCQPQ